MRYWAIADLHLALGCDKPMDIFGAHWQDHHQKIADDWDVKVAADDVVFLPGDFSWATKPEALAPDMNWLAARPGRKVMSKGNHDHWWPKSQKKLQDLLPPRSVALKKKAVLLDDDNGCIGVIVVRGGDYAPLTKYGDQRTQDDVNVLLQKELKELRASSAHLQELRRQSSVAPRTVIALCHYPPLPPANVPNEFAKELQVIFAEAEVSCCLYGHLHGENVGEAKVEGLIDGVEYRCVSCDQVDFQLQEIVLTTSA